VSKNTDNITGAQGGSAAALPLQPEPAPMRVSSANVPPGATPPKFTRFGSDGGDDGGERGRVAHPGLFERLSQFLRDVRSEMRRVSWPSANDVKNTTIITVVAVIFFAVYLFLVDQGLALFITQLERFVNWLFSGF